MVSRGELLVGTLALLGAKIVPKAPDSAFGDLPKAMWVWHTTPGDWRALRAFCRAERISTVMLSLSTDARSALIAGDQSIVQKLNDLRSGMTLQALTGEQDWITRQATSLPRSLGELLEIQRRHSTFDGLHLDIEPQLLPQWKNGDRSGVGAKYLELLKSIRTASSGIPLEVTAHPNYAAVVVDGQTLLGQVGHVADRVSLMAYRDNPDAAIRYAQPATDALRAARCPWRFGVLVNASRENGVSYAGLDASHFENDMVTLDRALHEGTGDTYAGLIFEDYRGLRQIL